VGTEPTPKKSPDHSRLKTPVSPVRGVAAGVPAPLSTPAWSGNSAVVSEFQVICGAMASTRWS
jgi:hypothetical protein